MKTHNNTDEAQIRTLLDDLASAIRAKDADRALSYYAAENVQFLLAPPLQYAGANAMDKQGLEAWFATFEGTIGYEVRGLSITTRDEIAFSHSLSRISGTKIDGEKPDVWVRSTVCFCKVDGQWKITHQHESVPFYMDGSYKAAIDLKP